MDLRVHWHRIAAATLLVALAAAAVLGEGRLAAAPQAPLGGRAAGAVDRAAGPAAEAGTRGRVLFSADGRYAFPLAGDITDMAWTHYHWNGGDAVDILARPGLSASSLAFRRFERSSVVAVTAGVVSRADNALGGTALVLRGDDLREYYYAHLSETWVVKPTRVRVGELLATIGRTGRWAQYLERHLHFAIASRWHRGLAWKTDVNAAEWFRSEFDLAWIDQTPGPYPAAYPSGSPLPPPYRIVRSFAEMRSRNPDLASIELAPEGGSVGLAVALPAHGNRGTGSSRAAAQDGAQAGVYSTLTGEVRVLRGTVVGLRVQVTNRHTSQTVVFSGLLAATVRTGDVVRRGGLIGATTGAIDYEYFDDGLLTDPTPTLSGRR